MKRGQYDQHDQDKLNKAKGLLMEVLEHNYGAPGMSKKNSRLETILAKLEALQNAE